MGQKLTMPRIRNQKKQVMKMDLIIIILQMLVMDRITGNTGNKESGTKVTAETDTTNDSVTELSTDVITAVSGRRLLLMIQQNGSAKFEKQGISVTVSSETVNTWKVNEMMRCRFALKNSRVGIFSEDFVRGEEVTEIPGTVVKIPISVLKGIQSPETVVIEDSAGKSVCKELSGGTEGSPGDT